MNYFLYWETTQCVLKSEVQVTFIEEQIKTFLAYWLKITRNDKTSVYSTKLNIEAFYVFQVTSKYVSQQ